MQVCTVNSLDYNFRHKKVKGKQVQQNVIVNSRVVPYSAANIKASYLPSFKAETVEMKKCRFLSFLHSIEVNGESIRNQVTDTSVFEDESFDIVSWGNFLTLFNNKAEGADKTYLEKFLSKNSFQELLSSPDFDPEEVFGIILEIKENMKFFDSAKLFETVNFISEVDSSQYDAIERVKALSYFVSLKDSEGNSLFKPVNPRQSMVSTYNYLMNINPASSESSSMEMLINLVLEGVVDKNIFEFLPQDGKISPFVTEDIDKLYNAYVDGVKPIDVFVPHFESKESAQKTLKVGDLFTVEGAKNCHIMLEENGSSMPLNIDKETYFKLFPPIKRFATTQNNIGNCWEISVLRALFATPQTRYTILRLFDKVGDDVVVKFNGGYSGETSYKNGLLPEEEDKESYSNGAMGFCLLENADGKELQAEKIRRYVLHLEKMKEKDSELAQQKLSELNKMLKQGTNSIILEYDYKKGDWKVHKYRPQKIKTLYNPEERNRDGGFPFELLFRLGYKQANELLSDEEGVDDLLKTDFEENIIFWSSKRKLSSVDKIVDNHTYFISSANYDENGNIKDYNVVNPWGIVEQTLTLQELKKYGSGFTYARKDSWS